MTETVTHLLPPAPFGRVIPAMITPMNKDGSVDYGAAANLARTLVADGADGILVNGTTGESPVTHMEERSIWSGPSRMLSMCQSFLERVPTTRRTRYAWWR